MSGCHCHTPGGAVGLLPPAPRMRERCLALRCRNSYLIGDRNFLALSQSHETTGITCGQSLTATSLCGRVLLSHSPHSWKHCYGCNARREDAYYRSASIRSMNDLTNTHGVLIRVGSWGHQLGELGCRPWKSLDPSRRWCMLLYIVLYSCVLYTHIGTYLQPDPMFTFSEN